MDSYREEIRRALVKATTDRTAVSIAAAIGISKQQLYQFQSTGYLGKEKLTQVAEWLAENDYIENEPFSAENEISLLAKDLSTLAGILNSPNYSKKFKGRKLRAWVEVAHKEMGELLALFEEREGDNE